MNTFGNIFRVEIFGESHGPALGCTLDGLPAGFQPDLEDIAFELSGGVRGKASKALHGVKRTLLKFFRVFSAADLRECR